MRTVVHLSDIHFGSVNEAIIAPLIRTINDVRPDVVAVSGDLTQRYSFSQRIPAFRTTAGEVSPLHHRRDATLLRR